MAADDVVEAKDYDEVLDVNWELPEAMLESLMKMTKLPMIPKVGESYWFPRTLVMAEVSMDVVDSNYQVVFVGQ